MKKYKLCLIGYPLKKTLSPLIFRKISKLINVKIKFEVIERKKIDPQKILNKKYEGFFITIPYKKLFHKYTISDKIANKLKIINCIKKAKNKFYSTNTDYKALIALTKKTLMKNKTATILGNGATAYISAYFLINREVKKIYLSARNHQKSTDIIELAKKNNIDLKLIKFPNIPKSEIIINATPLGMYFNQKIKLPKNTELVIDFAYTKKRKTDLIKNCIKNKIKYIGGIEILIMQALYGFKFISSIDLKKYYKKILKEFL